jgi:radical SAM protein with 4Fe4S-binding SPASM domain
MDIEDIIKVFSELGVRRFHFVQYGRSLYRHSDNFFLTKEQKLYIHNIVPELKNKYKELEIECQDDIPAAKPSIEEWNSRAICTGGRSSMIILPNGDVTLCEQLPHSPEYVVGNLLSQSLPDIWNGTAVESLLHPPREKFSGTACFVCADFDECHTRKGYCYRDSLSAFGNFYDAPPNCPKQDKIPLRLI